MATTYLSIRHELTAEETMHYQAELAEQVKDLKERCASAAMRAMELMNLGFTFDEIHAPQHTDNTISVWMGNRGYIDSSNVKSDFVPYTIVGLRYDQIVGGEIQTHYATYYTKENKAGKTLIKSSSLMGDYRWYSVEKVKEAIAANRAYCEQRIKDLKEMASLDERTKKQIQAAFPKATKVSRTWGSKEYKVEFENGVEVIVEGDKKLPTFQVLSVSFEHAPDQPSLESILKLTK